MSATTKLLLSLLVLTACLCACHDSSSAGGVCDGERCPKRCLALQRGGDCDTLETSCQERIFEAVGCVRGVEGVLPEIRLLTEEEERAERESAEADAGVADDAATPSDAADAAATTDAEPPRLTYWKRWELALGLLGIRTSMTSFDAVDDLAGYYSGADERITLIDRGEAQDSAYAQTTLAHEFVHGYQDQQVGLLELRQNTGPTTDSRLAVNCLVEGDATLYEELAWSLLRDLPADPDYFRSQFSARVKYARDQVAAAESPYDNLWGLHYGLCAQVLSELWFEGGNPALRALFDHPPISTVYWMRKAGQYTDADNLPRRMRCDHASPPNEFEYEGGDSLGAFAFFALLSHTLQEDGVYPNAQSWQRALDWQQDRFELFSGPRDESAASWRLRLSSEDLAKSVARDLEGSQSSLRVVQRGVEIELLVAESESVLAQWHDTLPEACPPLMP